MLQSLANKVISIINFHFGGLLGNIGIYKWRGRKLLSFLEETPWNNSGIQGTWLVPEEAMGSTKQLVVPHSQ